ncbi:PAS domain S-box protein [Kamptonema formosum]|uniref:PAS domain S-box protein n=1 Tax=Kamptonema formosum TaxID=331992 RepID=UPI0003490DE3|nr:PAS domain S-box protein [Oscillatoria sp. PCC 10802]
MADRHRKILIVDDSPEDRATYRRYLLQDSKYTYTFLEEDSGERALQLCDQPDLDVVLLDFRLPDLDGLEFLSELRAQPDKNSPPVVMLTGQGNESVAVTAMKSGATDYLVKGKISPENFRDAIHSAIENSYLRRQLQQSEEPFRTSVENMLDCFAIWSAIRDGSGRIIDFLIEYVNAAACLNTGMTQEEHIGKRLLQLQPALWQIGLFEECCQVVETGSPLVRESVICPDAGSPQSQSRFYDVCASKLDDGLAICWRDISERVLAQAQLRETTELLQALVEASPIAIVAMDRESRVQLWNPAAEGLFGWSEAEVLGRPFAAIPQQRRAEFQKLFEEELRGAVRHNLQLRRLRKDGSLVDVSLSSAALRDVAGEVRGAVGFLTDITERLRIEERLRLLESAVTGANDAVLIADTELDEPGPRILYVNEAFTRMTGYAPEEVLGKTPRILQGPETDRAALDRIRAALKNWQPVRAELVNYRKDGTPFSIELSVVPVADETGYFTHWTAIQRDISDRVRAERERAQLLGREQQARASAEAANRSKDEFLAMVSHELRSPLQGIRGWAQLLRSGLLNEAAAKRAFESIERNVQLQAQLIEDLLDASRTVTGKIRLNLQSVDLVPVIHAAVDTVQPAAAAKAIQLKVEIGTSSCVVLGDSSRLQQVVGNLLSNAIKFTPPKGRVGVRLSVQMGDSASDTGDRAKQSIPNPKSNIQHPTSLAQIQVADTGIGISPDFLPHAFDRFRQAEGMAKDGGLGLGLAIVRHLVELHGGTVSVESRGSGQGATFTAQLPLHESSTVL